MNQHIAVPKTHAQTVLGCIMLAMGVILMASLLFLAPSRFTQDAVAATRPTSGPLSHPKLLVAKKAMKTAVAPKTAMAPKPLLKKAPAAKTPQEKSKKPAAKKPAHK